MAKAESLATDAVQELKALTARIPDFPRYAYAVDNETAELRDYLVGEAKGEADCAMLVRLSGDLLDLIEFASSPREAVTA